MNAKRAFLILHGLAKAGLRHFNSLVLSAQHQFHNGFIEGLITKDYIKNHIIASKLYPETAGEIDLRKLQSYLAEVGKNPHILAEITSDAVEQLKEARYNIAKVKVHLTSIPDDRIFGYIIKNFGHFCRILTKKEKYEKDWYLFVRSAYNNNWLDTDNERVMFICMAIQESADRIFTQASS